MSNGKVTAIIVPQTGRIASFAKNNGDNVFWENQSLSGHLPEVPAAEWQNFGGDKSWPAPQSSWPEITKRAWPPPTAFDQMAVKIEADETGVTTTSQVDPDFGIRVLRHIALKPNEPTMEVTTTYEKVQGTPVEASIWTITQLKDPESVRVLLAQNSSTMPDGFITQMGTKMPSLKSLAICLRLIETKQHRTRSGRNLTRFSGLERKALF